MTDDHHFWNLLGKKLSGEASAEELAELEVMLKKYPEAGYTVQNISDIWHLHPQAHTPETEAAFEIHKRQLQDFTPTLPQPETEHISLKNRIAKPAIIGLAFATALLFFIGFWPGPKTQPEATAPTQGAEMSTAHGSRSKLVLPDSSVVWLNSGSRLTYDKGFGISNRDTRLQGEAFFEVRKAKLPFIVQALAMHIKVMGTAFNVKAYDGEPAEASLIHGQVEVTLDKRPGETFHLKPNEKLVVAPLNKTSNPSRKKEPLVVLKEVTPVAAGGGGLLETLWVENKLYFHEESFAEVARKMERWYNVEIQITDAALAQLQVGGGPFENETVEQALQALQIAFNFRFSTLGNRITITR